METLGQPLKKSSISNMLWDDIRWNHIKCSVKTAEDRKRGRKKPKEQISQTENSKTVTNMVDLNLAVSIIT